MRFIRAACLAATTLLAGCSSPSFENNRQDKAEFDRKVTCVNSARHMLDGRGDGDVFTSKETYIQESFYSPERNSCIAVLVLTTGELNPLPSGGLNNTLSETYDVVDTLSYEVVMHKSSGIGDDRSKTREEIDKAVRALKGK